MKRVGIVLHGERATAVETGRWLADRLSSRGVEVEALPSDAARVGVPSLVASETFPEGVELVFVLGGDGTLLRAAQLVAGSKIPLLGVNLGRLGFLSELERGELEDGLERILAEGFEIEERMILRGDVVEGDRRTPLWALNDVIVEKVAIGRAIKLAVEVSGEPFVAWAADGVVVATSTGSTAYSFSAGGPVVTPGLDCIIVTPVAPHGLFGRSFIVTPDEEITIRVTPDPDTAALSADGGPALPLSSGAEIRLRAGEDRVRLAKIGPAPFWRLVREKFGLPPNPRG